MERLSEIPPLLCVEKVELSDFEKCIPTKGKRGFRGLYNCFGGGHFNLCVVCVRKKVTKIIWYGESGNRAKLPQVLPSVKSKIMITVLQKG